MTGLCGNCPSMPLSGQSLSGVSPDEAGVADDLGGDIPDMWSDVSIEARGPAHTSTPISPPRPLRLGLPHLPRWHSSQQGLLRRPQLHHRGDRCGGSSHPSHIGSPRLPTPIFVPNRTFSHTLLSLSKHTHLQVIRILWDVFTIRIRGVPFRISASRSLNLGRGTSGLCTRSFQSLLRRKHKTLPLTEQIALLRSSVLRASLFTAELFNWDPDISVTVYPLQLKLRKQNPRTDPRIFACDWPGPKHADPISGRRLKPS